MASSVSQSSMIEAKDFKSGMPGSMGPAVPKSKPIVSHDYIGLPGHNVPMTEDDEDIAESAWREAFRLRIRAIQGDRSADDMADLLGITRTRYSKYVGGRASAVPTRLLPKLAKIGAVSLEWLIDGPKKAAPANPAAAKGKRKRA